MVLYSADISKLAQPVKGRKKVKEIEPKTEQVEQVIDKPIKRKRVKNVVVDVPQKKKVKKEKVVEVQDYDESEVEEPLEKVVEAIKEPKRKRVKKMVQAEALVEAVEEPKRKRAKKVVQDVEAVEEPKKKRAKKVVQDVEAVEEPKKKDAVKKVPKKRDDSEPPQWFNKYVESVKKEEAALKTEKTPSKQIKHEAQEHAQKSWNDGLTRDRVTHEVDNHMSRLYSQIFARN